MTLLDALVQAQSPHELEVIADALAEQDDVRGKAMVLGLKLNPDTPAFQSFLAEHAPTLLGQVYAWQQLGCAEVEYRFGLVNTLRLATWPTVNTPPTRELEAIFQAPGLIRLENLEIGALETNGSFDLVWRVLPRLATLESLSVGTHHQPYGDEHQLSWLWLGAVGRAIAQCPQLRRAVLRGSAPDFQGLVAPRLEALTVISSSLSGGALADLGRTQFPRLRSLELSIGDGEYGDCATLGECAALLEVLPHVAFGLRTLGLCNTEYTNELVPLLAGSEVLRQLTSVDLSLGVLDAFGAQQLLRLKPSFAHLECIELGDNVLTEAERKTLSADWPAIQFRRDASWRKHVKVERYVSLSE